MVSCLHTDLNNSYCVLVVFLSDPFEVAFVQTTYTVVEGDSLVEVCVNLTQPQIDILDEFIYVEAFNDESSVYIPSGAPLASEYITNRAYLLTFDYSNCFL